jgi:glycosyltransferase involved in cell wall biosynthesis
MISMCNTVKSDAEFHPLISIITVCFNAGNTIERTFRGVANQLYPNIEYIVIDGGSTDDTLGHIEAYKHLISFFISEKDNGIYDAMNKGINMARGEVIGIINADDYYTSNSIDHVMKIWQRDKTIDVICGKCSTIGSAGNVIRTDSSVIDFDNQVVNVLHPSTFVSKKCYEKNGVYKDNYVYAGDYELFCRLASRNAKFEFIDTVSACFCIGGFGSTVGIVKEWENFHINCRYWGLTRALLLFPRSFVLPFFRRKIGNLFRKIGLKKPL